MALSLYQTSVESFSVTLRAFTLILDKAEAHAKAANFDASVYAELRLRPDMLAFPRQVQIFCDLAKNGCARLAGVEAPHFEDHERTVPEIKARIEKTLAFLATIHRESLEAGESREITFPVGSQKAKMIGRNYLVNFITPNYYFHLATAYDLLRYAGVSIGKRDYLGEIPGFSFI